MKKQTGEQYNLVQIGDIKICSTDKTLKEVATIATELAAQQGKRMTAEQETLLGYIG